MVYPWCRMIKRSNKLKISEDGWWIVVTTILPESVYLFSNLITFSAECTSRPVVGSSRNNIVGLNNNSIPIQSLFISPPDKLLCIVSPTNKS